MVRREDGGSGYQGSDRGKLLGRISYVFYPPSDVRQVNPSLLSAEIAVYRFDCGSLDSTLPCLQHRLETILYIAES